MASLVTDRWSSGTKGIRFPFNSSKVQPKIWVKVGLDGGARLLDAGCNDLGGTLMGEIITRSAGASHGQEVSPADFERVITNAGRTPYERTTVYGRAEPRRPVRRTIPLAPD